jgi:hypothetical protein
VLELVLFVGVRAIGQQLLHTGCLAPVGVCVGGYVSLCVSMHR